MRSPGELVAREPPSELLGRPQGAWSPFAQWLRYGQRLGASGAVKPVRQAGLVPLELGTASGRQGFGLLGDIADGSFELRELAGALRLTF